MTQGATERRRLMLDNLALLSEELQRAEQRARVIFGLARDTRHQDLARVTVLDLRGLREQVATQETYATGGAA